MKAIIKKAFAVYATDSSGYKNGDPIVIYPFKAAAENSPENKNLGGYSYICIVNLLCFEEVNYLLKEKISSEKVIGGGTVKLGIAQGIYQDYSYLNGSDQSKYIVGDKNLLDYIYSKGRANISTAIMTRDSEDFFLLESGKTFTIKPFIMSRELAIQNALDKLSDEEKSLLGLK